MESESWLCCEKTAVLQGGLLHSEQLCHSKQLCTLRKQEWGTVGHPVLQAVTEICEEGHRQNQQQVDWRKKVICILWSKLLEMEKGNDVDTAWRENPFFSAQNSLPKINRALLFELVKSMGFSRIYVELLLCFPPSALCSELARLVEHSTADSTKEDAQFLLEVWWELWKGKGRQEQALDQAFAAQCYCYTNPSTELSPQAHKKFKPDPDRALASTCVPSMFLLAFKEMKDHVTSPEMCCFALSNCLDTFYTSFLLDHTVDTSPELYLQNLSKVVSIRKRQVGTEVHDLPEAIQEAQRDLAATCSPSRFKPCGMTLMHAVQTMQTLTKAWGKRELLTIPESDVPTNAFRLKQSLGRVIGALEELQASEILVEGERQDVNELKLALKNTLDVLLLPDLECSSAEMARVTIAILDRRLEKYQEITSLFVSEINWASLGSEWISCLERNRDAFQHKELVLKLVSVLVANCQSDTDIAQCKKLREIILDIFSRLPLLDKNETLAGMLASWGKRGLNSCLPHAVSEGFSEELNLSFNSIIQSQAKGSLSTAVSTVACVAFQDPEATLRRCCHMAVASLGAHALLAHILWQLPGLVRHQPCSPEGRGGAGGSLLCSCLQEAVWGKLSSAQEEKQFLSFLEALMCPSTVAGESAEGGMCLLPPEKVVQTFVLPNLSPSLPHGCSLEFCLQVLMATLKQTPQADSPHWVMSCSPFPLLFALCQLLSDSCRCWEEPAEGALHVSMESKELLTLALTVLGEIVGREVAAAPSSWSRALFWLRNKLEALDWTVPFHLKPVWGEHFKNEVPCSLLAVCDLPEEEWSGLKLLQYGQGTGLLAWAECCCISEEVRDTMLSHLALNQRRPEDVNMFSKGLLVALVQTLPWCTAEGWGRLLGALRELLDSGRLYVPYSLEYVDFLPLLDLRAFSGALRLSVLLLRVFQLLCGSSCADWLPAGGWAHAARLYAGTVRETLALLRARPPAPAPTTPPKNPGVSGGGQEVLFVLTQLFCHVLHVLVMLPGRAEPLFLCALEIVTQCEALLAGHPGSSSALERENTKHFLTSIADNLDCAEMKAALHQKIAQL
ncbi:hypothetical protein MATL_G00116090 [Megalops atlanticus]|uniref:Gem-associated protein 4 n=1 Tax=Megalops atlanticus TaxID=7932 RepID=A0A9D3PYX7_MEGAT|nr:hypothetical protein MATL_G00116090 [Megalops atlanticus]